jgi:hypothetical protein
MIYRFTLLILLTASLVKAEELDKKNVLDFSAGVIEGNVNRPTMLMELGANYKEFSDLVLIREDFNNFHELDSKKRFKYVDENL